MSSEAGLLDAMLCTGFPYDVHETVDEVVFARPGDLRLLGARTIEGFAALVDARRKRLVAAGPLPVAPGPGGSNRSDT